MASSAPTEGPPTEAELREAEAEVVRYRERLDRCLEHHVAAKTTRTLWLLFAGYAALATIITFDVCLETFEAPYGLLAGALVSLFLLRIGHRTIVKRGASTTCRFERLAYEEAAATARTMEQRASASPGRDKQT